MAKSLQIIGVGNPIVDTLIEVSEDFIKTLSGGKGGMILVDAETMQQLMDRIPDGATNACGGSAGNTTFALARLGASSTFLGKVGNDEAGLFYMNTFADYGGDTTRFKVGHIANGRCLSLITPDSQRTMRTDLGASATLTPEDITSSDFKNVAHAHIEGYLLFNPALITKVLQSAKEAGVTVSLDLASYEVVEASRDILSDLIKNYVDIVFANEDEAKTFLGDKPYDQLASELADLTNGIGVVKMGASGSFISKNGETIRVSATPGIQAIDTTGAGDFWAAGFLYAWIHNQPLSTCGEYGSLLGGEVVKVIGTQLENSTWEKIKSTFSPRPQ